jgi:hypothetical protein
MVLMFPSFTLGEYTEKLELKGGVQPHVFVERAGRYSAGSDPILERGKEEIARIVAARPRSDVVAGIVGPGRVASQSPAGITDAGCRITADALVAKMVEALGGEKALRAHAHRTLRGTAELVGLPMKGPFVQKTSAPDKWLVEMRLGDLLVRQGFDGNIAWSDNPMTGKQVLNGAAAEAVREQAQFHRVLQMRALYREIVPLGGVAFDGKDCIEVKLVSASGARSTLYVEEATGFTAGTRAPLETPIGSVDSTTYFRQYRDFNGYQAASEICVESSVQRQLIRIDSVGFEEIAPVEYAPPAGAPDAGE